MGKNLDDSIKIRTFANDDYNSEPSVLAVGSGRPIPTLSGKSAELFYERMLKVEEEAKKRMNEKPSLETLKRNLTFEKFFLEQDEKALEERKKRITQLESKIKEIENGKAKEE